MRPLLLSSLLILCNREHGKRPEGARARASARAARPQAAIKPMPAHAPAALRRDSTPSSSRSWRKTATRATATRSRRKKSTSRRWKRAALADDPDVWEEVVLRLRGREMPPRKSRSRRRKRGRPSPAGSTRELKRIDRTTPPDPGRVTARRLNRTEYNNTIGDLLGVTMRPADDFPQDDSGYGFDNIADVLSLSPGLMEKYLSAADEVARTALFGPPSLKPTLCGCGPRAAASRRGADVPAAVRRDRAQPAQRLPRHPPRSRRRRIHSSASCSAACARRVRRRSRIALWVDEQEVMTRVARSGGGRVVQRGPPGLRRAGGRVPRQAGRGRPLARRWRSRASTRGSRRSYGGTESVDASDRAERVQAAGRAPRPSGSRSFRKRFDDAQAELDKIPMNGVRVNTVDIGGPYCARHGPVGGEPARRSTRAAT